MEGGVELPSAEFKVEEDLVVGTVPWDSLEDPEVRKLALDRRRSSLKKGIGSARNSTAVVSSARTLGAESVAQVVIVIIERNIGASKRVGSSSM